MGFISDVKFLTNLIKAHKSIQEVVAFLEKECTSLKERYTKLNSDVQAAESKIEEFNEMADELEKQLQDTQKRFSECQSKIYQMQQLEALEYINTLIAENGYEMKKIGFSMGGFKVLYSRFEQKYYYYKKDILSAVEFMIQEFAAQEGICYEKLRKSLFEINKAWNKTYQSLGSTIRQDEYTTKLLFSSFMMLAKKNCSEKKNK